MALYTIETVTIITVVVIGIILAIYLTILKRNGWLGRSAQFYLCPNRECRKVFQKPVELRDLSETPARVYRGCPHCGIDLEPVLASCPEKKSALKANASLQQENIEMKIEDSALKIESRNPEIGEQVESSHENSSKPVETEKSQIAIGNRKRLLESAEPASARATSKTRALKILQESHLPLKTLKEVTSNTEVKMSDDCFEGCPDFFEYLQSLPKGTMAPHPCHSCPKRVDCNMHARTIASVYTGQESATIY
jgi:hypothetical protein